MRQLSLIALVTVVGGVLGCDGPASPGTSRNAASPSTTEAQPAPQQYDPLAEQLAQLEDLLAEVELEPAELQAPLIGILQLQVDPRDFQQRSLLPDSLREYRDQPALPRSWMNCDGYITNNATAGFCEDSPPSDWGRFRFNGEPYFFVPLGPSA